MHNLKRQESCLVFLTIGDFDRDSNHDADCDIGDLGQTNANDKDDGDDGQNGEQSVKEESLVISSTRAFQWTLYKQDSCVFKSLKAL